VRHSLEGRLALFAAAIAAAAALLTAALAYWFGGPAPGAIAGLAVSVPAAIWLARRAIGPITRILSAVADGIASMKDRDFSISITRNRDDELGDLVDGYNTLGRALRSERQNLYQRELLLDTVIQSTPLAMLLTNEAGVLIYANLAARQLFAGGRRLEGRRLGDVIAAASQPLVEAIERRIDGLFTTEEGSDPETWHLSCRRLVLNTKPHDLYLLKQLTREIARQEVATWKRVIRVISHELNNSLAPITSLAHSGLLLADRPDKTQLSRIFTTIEDRARHLHEFIDGYARFAKLPQPRIEAVAWEPFLESLAAAVEFRHEGPLPAVAAHFDPAQIEQVLINLLKNAHEAGSAAAEISLEIGIEARAWRIRIADRGHGMSEAVLHQALLPFYSTKSSGTGLGLPLCREIVEAHGGRLALANRARGGLAVTLWLPDEIAGQARGALD
jgi:nitrogen fixation/metabolism regulation signal transduction histidine kinase